MLLVKSVRGEMVLLNRYCQKIDAPYSFVFVAIDGAGIVFLSDAAAVTCKEIPPLDKFRLDQNFIN